MNKDTKIKENTICRRDNKLLYRIDLALVRFIHFFVSLVRYLLPNSFKTKLDKLLQHDDIVYNVLGLTFFNALGGFCLIATQIKLANYLGASTYGVYSYYLAIGEIGAMFVRYGRNKTMLRDLVQFPDKRESLIVSTFLLSLINLALFLIVTFLFSDQLDINISIASFLLVMSPCLISLDFAPVYESLKMMSWHSIYLLLQKFAFLVIIWCLFIAQVKIGLTTIGAIVTTTWIVILYMEFHEIINQLKINFLQRIKVSAILKLYKENFSIFMSCVCGVAFGPLLRYILNNYSDSHTVGIYAAGLQIYSICLFFNSQVARVGNPMMAEAGKDNCPINKRRKMVLSYLLIMMAISSVFAIPMLLIPKIITDAFYTQEYAELSMYLPFLSILMISMSIGVVFMQYLISIRKDKIYFAIYSSTALLTIGVAYWLIPLYGALGAFISFCIPHSIGCICYALASFPSLKR